MLPALIVLGAGVGLAGVMSVSVGQRGVDPRDAGTAGAMNNVSQQLGSAIGVALISTFVAAATSSYLRDHAPGAATVVNAAVHGYTTGYWWAAGIYAGSALVMSALIRPGTRMYHEPGKPGLLEEPTAIS